MRRRSRASALLAALAGSMILASSLPRGAIGDDTSIQAITDIVVQKGGICPDSYHGLENGKKASDSDRHYTDVNKGIGGDTVGICARIEQVARTSSEPILTGIAVSHWPHWNTRCPEGFVPAEGNGGGKLTTRTKGRCWRQGLCVRWTPANEIKDHPELDFLYVSDLFLQFSAKPGDLGLGWFKAGQDIHAGCGGAYVYVHARQSGFLPGSDFDTMTNAFGRYQGPEPGESQEAYLERVARGLAPLVYLHPDEKYFPSSLEYYLEHVRLVDPAGREVPRTLQPEPLAPANLAAENPFAGHHLVTRQELGCDSCVEPEFLHGQDPLAASIPVYTVISRKTEEVTDIVYFLFYPYNRGKRVCVGLYTDWGGCAGGYSTFGHHVADWEHMTVRLEQGRPAKLYLAAHNFGSVFDEDLPGSREIMFRGTHPVVYSAWGAHGLYARAGEHEYQSLATGDSLVDKTAKGRPWYTWRNVELLGVYRPSGPHDFGEEWSWLGYRGRWGNPHGSKKLSLPDFMGGTQHVLEAGPRFPRYAIDNIELE